MITLEPIAHVRNSRHDVEDDFWGGVVSDIVLGPPFDAESLQGIEDFSHVEILFHFHLTPPERVITGARHPRNNPDWPKVGIFAQRGKNRPNRLGLATVRVVRREGTILTVQDLDAIDGTPILDIKPVMREFAPIGEVRQPAWAAALMRDYWKTSPEG